MIPEDQGGLLRLQVFESFCFVWIWNGKGNGRDQIGYRHIANFILRNERNLSSRRGIFGDDRQEEDQGSETSVFSARSHPFSAPPAIARIPPPRKHENTFDQ